MKIEIIEELTLKLNGEEKYTLGCIAYHFKKNLLKENNMFVKELKQMVEELIKLK